jgi:hypothetical protein
MDSSARQVTRVTKLRRRGRKEELIVRNLQPGQPSHLRARGEFVAPGLGDAVLANFI